MQVQLRCFYIEVAQYVLNMPGAYPFSGVPACREIGGNGASSNLSGRIIGKTTSPLCLPDSS